MDATDITAALQAAAASGPGFDLIEDSVFHQGVQVTVDDFDFAYHGHTLQMYGGPVGAPPVTVNGVVCTGPAAYFLGGDGTPIGSKAGGPGGNVFSIAAKVTGSSTHNGRFDDNIHLPTDVWGGAAYFANKDSVAPSLTDYEIINNYGGVNKYPDPVHVEAEGQVVKNYKAGLVTAIPTDPTVHGGVPGGLICAGGLNPVQDVEIDTVNMAGFLEIDGILSGGSIKNFTGTHCLIGKSVPAGSWNGHLWDHVTLYWPYGSPLNFNGGPYTDWTIENSSFTPLPGVLGQWNFKATWGPGNTPATLP